MLAIGQETDPTELIFRLNTVINENRPSITFDWKEMPDSSEVAVWRKNINSDNWTEIHRESNISDFTDNDIQPENKYEYKIRILKPCRIPTETFVTAGIKVRETEYRGKIILLVDSLFAEPLQVEISRLESDLIGDGWEIIRKDISRNSTVKQVKYFIYQTFRSDFLKVNAVFLLGHIPVPYSGEFAFDGHVGEDEHEGAWPADLYYGSMNEFLWTDKHVNNTKSKNIKNHNIPGDGKFDRDKLDKNQHVELAIGRVDFFDLPAFEMPEVELMRNYLDKNHAFRHKLINPKMQALVDDNLRIINNGEDSTDEFMALSGWRNFTALFNFKNVKAGKVFTDAVNDSYMWTYGCGWGDFTLCKDVGTTTDFVNNSPKTVFTAFYGSWFGDWDTQNNFLRSALASNGWILTTCWAGRPHYVFHHMGLGETIGSCIRRTQNNYDTYYDGLDHYRKGVHVSLLGDPTLRMHVVSPVKSLIAEFSDNNTIELNWQSPDENVLGYYVYRFDTTSNKYHRINKELVYDNVFVDVSPEPGENDYMVRALQLTQSASGSYYNLSQGVFKKVYPTNISDIKINKQSVDVNPNPFTNHITIKTSIHGNYNIIITTINGQLLLSKELEGSEHQLDLSFLSSWSLFCNCQVRGFCYHKEDCEILTPKYYRHENL